MKTSTTRVLIIATTAISLISLMIWFQPWRLFTGSEVIESAPSQSAKVLTQDENVTAGPAKVESLAESESTEPDVPDQIEIEPAELASGSFISHEHETTGEVKILSLADGSRVLRLEGLQTTDGPDLEVWLSDAPVISGFDGWFLADNGEYFSLGKLKGTSGDHNYTIPADLDLARFSSVSIWCVRFAVSFGAAEFRNS